MHARNGEMKATTSVVLPGLSAPAEILVDRWGVPHIYAASTADAFRVQGYNAARDRLWQIDFWRRKGLGTLSEVFGSEYVERDRAARLFLYRGEMRNEWLAYGSDTKRICHAFVEGINAFISSTREDPSLLPFEFRELGYKPAFWDATDIVRIRSQGLYSNLAEEVKRAQTLREFGPEIEDLRRQREPYRPLTVPSGLSLNDIPNDVLNVYTLLMTPPVFPGDLIESSTIIPAPEGSNNWAVSGERTATGRPMFANDPHRATAALPGLRYIAHLNAPGIDIIGGGEPSLPGVSIGHNGRLAFGMTFFSSDQEDLYVYELNPDEPTEYRYRGRWIAFEEVETLIPVRGGDDVRERLLYTVHGPVLSVRGGRAFAVRAAWLEQGMAPYLASLEYQSAQNKEEYLAALNRWGAPTVNHVFADVDGNIGRQSAGLTPIRKTWDGTLPVPGDGTYEWAGFYDVDELPDEHNPERGWIATANEMNVGSEPFLSRNISFDWFAPYRRERIDELLEATHAVTVDDLAAIQNDVLSIPARRIVSVLRDLPIGEADCGAGFALLTQWDGALEASSAPAALFEVWYRRHLRPLLLTEVAQIRGGDTAADCLSTWVSTNEELLADARIDLQLVESPGDWFGEDAIGSLSRIFATSLRAAVAETEILLGSEHSEWAWGKLHTASAIHPLRNLLEGRHSRKFVLGPAPRGGSGDTVCDTAYNAATFAQTGGATFRVVIDVGNWDGSIAMNAPGQSGDVDSHHYGDLFEPWAAGSSFPLLYSRPEVEKATEARIVLTP